MYTFIHRPKKYLGVIIIEVNINVINVHLPKVKPQNT